MIKNLLKRVLPVEAYRSARGAMLTRGRLSAWREVLGQITRTVADTVPRSFLIIPSDPWQIVGSRGDDAMVSTAVAEMRRRVPNCRIGVLCVSEHLPPIAADLGLVAVPIWLGSEYREYLSILDNWDAVAVIGADVMDGHYSVPDAIRAWTFADLAARRGKRAFVVGFSFSSHPAKELADIMPFLDASLKIYARDAVSQKVVQALTPVVVDLVADSAFQLPPSPTAPEHAAAESWAREQRAEGRFICAFNTHPMIFRDCDPEKVARLNSLFVDVLAELAKRHPVAFLLVPHDFRDEIRGDNASLAPLHIQMMPTLGDRLFYAASACRAAELKSLVAIGDLLITGRMHLGVGALSLGVPMWAINPQDKFIGLFEHFGLPDLRLEPEAALDRARLFAFLDGALSSWRQVRDKVQLALPSVKLRAGANFSSLDS